MIVRGLDRGYGFVWEGEVVVVEQQDHGLVLWLNA